ncbi:hypothetical protein ELI_3044 [Eubacterium callanderi]|uniref:Uncharacterized protein n=1 Tax=Eubacterium callanderi TaxID=53442 RepID=E3GF04_9FIRM|nr:hypothetical protein ELI_3044 [Eubacterium callanderi]
MTCFMQPMVFKVSKIKKKPFRSNFWAESEKNNRFISF